MTASALCCHGLGASSLLNVERLFLVCQDAPSVAVQRHGFGRKRWHVRLLHVEAAGLEKRRRRSGDKASVQGRKLSKAIPMSGAAPIEAPPLTRLPEERAETSGRHREDVERQRSDGGAAVRQEFENGRGIGPFRGKIPENWSVRWKRIAKKLSSLPLAIGELCIIAALSSVGTVLEQDRDPQYYLARFNEAHPFLGVLTGDWVLLLGLDRIYSSPVFLSLLALLTASLIACSSTRQWPMVRVARRWSFVQNRETLEKMELAVAVPRAQVKDLATLLMARGYQVFSRGDALYGFKGLAGRFAPIGVHAALVLVMAGATQSVLMGYKGTVMTPQGLGFVVGDVLRPNTFLAQPTSASDLTVVVNRFFIDYRPDGSIAQFHSDLSVLERDGSEALRKTIAVNEPLRYAGLTAYQTDWSIATLQVSRPGTNGGAPFRLPMARLPQPGDPEAKLFGTYLPIEGAGEGAGGVPKGITFLARDLEQVVLYDADGAFVGVRRPGSRRPITVDGQEIVIEDLIGATGLELKVDPGVPTVYAGFGGLMLTTCISYLSHSQVWALQEGAELIVGGRSNRGKVDFKQEIEKTINEVPEVFSREEIENKEKLLT